MRGDSGVGAGTDPAVLVASVAAQEPAFQPRIDISAEMGELDGNTTLRVGGLATS